MFTPVGLGADKTTVSVATGNQEFHALYGFLGNIQNEMRKAHCDAVVPLAFLPIPKGTSTSCQSSDASLHFSTTHTLQANERTRTATSFAFSKNSSITKQLLTSSHLSALECPCRIISGVPMDTIAAQYSSSAHSLRTTPSKCICRVLSKGGALSTSRFCLPVNLTSH